MQPLLVTFAHFQNYIRQPHYRVPLASQPTRQGSLTARLFLAEYPLISGLLLLAVGAALLMQALTGQDVFEALIEHHHFSVSLLIVSLFLAVIIEEAIFRAILRLTLKRLRNIMALLLWIPLGYYYQTIKEVSDEFAMLWLIPVWGVVVYLFGCYLKRPTVFARINTFWQTNFQWIFYGITGLYAAGKIVDDVSILTGWQVLLLPILLLVGLLNSVYFSYIRMTYGFWYAVAVHALVLIASLTSEVIHIL